MNRGITCVILSEEEMAAHPGATFYIPAAPGAWTPNECLWLSTETPAGCREMIWAIRANMGWANEAGGELYQMCISFLCNMRKRLENVGFAVEYKISGSDPETVFDGVWITPPKEGGAG